MIKVQADTVGADVVSSPFSGEVESVFSRACTLRIDDGRRFTLLHGGIDRGMRIVAVADHCWPALHDALRIGMPVSGDGNGLITPFGVIDWNETPVWNSPEAPEKLPDSTLRQGLSNATALLKNMLGDLVYSPLWLAAHRRFDTLCHSLSHNDLSRNDPFETPVVRLIGAGPGLTPSGDDLLTGLLGALNASRDSRFTHVRDIVRRYSDRTGAVSRDYLDQACRGWWTEKLHDVFLATVSNDDSLEPAMRALAGHGHSSGLDLETGLIAGLSIATGCPGPFLFKEPS